MKLEIEKYFKDNKVEKWNPVIVPLKDEGSISRIEEALIEIGRRTISDNFILDETNREVYTNIALYFFGHGPYDIKKGVFLWGNVGCGKTTLMKVIGYFIKIFVSRNGFRLEHCHDVNNNFQLIGAETFEKYKKGSVCFDELGSESKTASYYGSTIQVMPIHIDIRYRLFIDYGKWTHFTSNFDLKWITQNYGVRESDRIKEMCNVIQMSGSSRRK